MKENAKSYDDDYNYPSLGRKDLMSLSTLTNRDFPIRKINKINTKRDWSVNLYNLDIERAVPRRTNVFVNKVDFINKIDDIDKARPKPERIWKYPDFILNCRDIEKAYPKKINVFSQRKVNPLEPKYNLPKPKTSSPIPPPKFIRDSIGISDIEGTHPRPLFRDFPKSIQEEVKGSHPRMPYERRVIHNSLDFRDVTKQNFRYNPYKNENYKKEIEGSRPIGISLYKNRGLKYMSNDDIAGSGPGTANKYALYSCDRSKLYSCDDIEGAKANTLKKGIITKRVTNPLNPSYQYLGNSENLDCYGPLDSNRISKTNKAESKANEIRKSQTINIDNKHNIKKFYTVSSQSCNNIFIPSIQKDNKEELINQNKNKPIDWDSLPCFDDKPKFDKELYKKPNPNHEYVHNPDLFFGKKNKNSRLDIQRQKALSLPNNDTNYLKIFKSKSCDNIKLNESQMSTFNKNALLKQDPLFNKLQDAPCYEKQLDYFLKDNNYNVF